MLAKSLGVALVEPVSKLVTKMGGTTSMPQSYLS